VRRVQGTPRRKKKVVRAAAATDDKKLQATLKKLNVNTIPGIEEVRCRCSRWRWLPGPSLASMTVCRRRSCGRAVGGHHAR
jgi:hypothetical protein